jgi:hypothetical protein
MELYSLQPENQEKETRCGAIVGISHGGDLDITRGVIVCGRPQPLFWSGVRRNEPASSLWYSDAAVILSYVRRQTLMLIITHKCLGVPHPSW